MNSFPRPVDVVDHAVRAADGFVLAARTFAPPKPWRGTVLIHGATAVPQRYYVPFATHLASRGHRVVTYDYRGVGGSRPSSLAGFEATMQDWAELDARALFAFARSGPGPLTTIGHSFGAQLLGLFDEAREVERAVFVAGQLGFMGHWPLAAQPRLALFWYGLVPSLTTALGYLPAWSGLGEELPAGVAQQWGRWCRSPGYYLDHLPEAGARLAAFDRPALAFSFTDDDFAPKPAVDAFLSRLEGAPLTHLRRHPADLGAARIGHFGFFRDRFAPTLWEEVSDFLAGQTVEADARPSLREPHLELALEALG